MHEEMKTTPTFDGISLSEDKQMPTSTLYGGNYVASSDNSNTNDLDTAYNPLTDANDSDSMSEKKDAFTLAPLIRQLSVSSNSGNQSQLGNVHFISEGDIKKEGKLGSGAFGIVYRGNYRGKSVAIKALDLKHAKSNFPHLLERDLVEAFNCEVTRLASLNHVNLVQFRGLYTEQGMSYMVMEFCNGGSLQNLLDDKNKRLPWSKCWRLALEMAQGLAYLHHRGILHCDLKAENILIDNEGRVKLADLGVAQIDTLLDSKEAKVVAQGIQDYRFSAPEVLQGISKMKSPADVYAYGIMLWQLASRSQPDSETRQTILSKSFTGEREPIPSDCPASFRQLILDCWQVDPLKRPTMEVVVKRLIGLADELHPEPELSKIIQRLDLMLDEHRPEFANYLVPFSTQQIIREDLDIFWCRIEEQEAKAAVIRGQVDNDIMPEKANTQDAKKTPKPIRDVLTQFLNNKQEPVLVILGEAGLGKSLTTYHLADELLQLLREQQENRTVPATIDQSTMVERNTQQLSPESNTYNIYHGMSYSSDLVLTDTQFITAEAKSSTLNLTDGQHVLPSHNTPLIDSISDLKEEESFEVKEIKKEEISEISGWIPVFIRPSISKWQHSQLTNALQTALDFFVDNVQETSSTEISKSLHTEKILFILDGYDELQSDIIPKNLPEQLGLANFPNAKLIVTGRTGLIPEGDHFARFNFQSHYSVHYLLPFNLNQLFNYLSTQLHWDVALQQTYRERFEAATTLRGILRNPFVSSLFVQDFETMAKKDFKQLKRPDIYAASTERWLKTQAELLDPEVQAQLIVVTPVQVGIQQSKTNQEQLLTSFQIFAEQVAFICYRDKVPTVDQSTLQVSLLEQQQPWLRLAEIVTDQGQKKFRARSAGHRAILSEEDYLQILQLRVQQFQAGSPLKHQGSTYSYRHKSFFEYWVAQAILRGLDQLTEPSALVSTPLADLLSLAPIQREAGVLNFLKEGNIKAYPQTSLRRDRLMEQVEASKIIRDHKETKENQTATTSQGGTQNISIPQIAANAATILNAAGVSFIGRDWQDVCIPGADLSGAIIDSTNLNGADLPDVRLQGAWLRQNNLVKATLSNLRMGEYPGLTLGSQILACAYSPDGSKFAVGCKDSIYLYDTHTRLLQQTFKGHTDAVTSVAFSRSGESLLSGSWDSSVRLWDAKTGNCERVMRAHTDKVHSVAFSPSDRYVLSGSQDRSVRLWDAKTGDCARVMTGHKYAVTSVAFSPSGEYLLSGSWDTTLRLWDTQTGNCEQEMTGHTGTVYSVAFSPSGELVVSGSQDRSVRLWDIKTGDCEQVMIGHTREVNSVTFSPSGERVLSGSVDKSLRLWNAKTGVCERMMTGHTKEITSVAFSPSSECVLSGSFDKNLRFWDAKTSGCEREMVEKHTGVVSSVAISPSGEYVLSGSRDKSVRLWDAKTGGCERVMIGHTKEVTSVAFNPLGEYVISGGWDNLLRLWDIKTGDCVRVMSGHTNTVYSVAFSPSGEYVLSGSFDKSLRLWDAKTSGCVRVMMGHTGEIRSVAFSPSGEYVLSGSDDKSLRLWDAKTGDCERVMAKHTGPVWSVAFSPSGEYVLSGSRDKNVHLWNTKTGDCVQVITGHAGSVLSVAFSPSGQYVLSGSEDQSVRIWDAQTGACLLVIAGFPNSITAVHWHHTASDDDYLVTGCEDNGVRVFKLITIEQGQNKTFRAILSWTSQTGILVAIDTDLTNAIGLSRDNADLLKQHGAVGEFKIVELESKSEQSLGETSLDQKLETKIPRAILETKSSDQKAMTEPTVVAETNQPNLPSSVSDLSATNPGSNLTSLFGNPVIRSANMVTPTESLPLRLNNDNNDKTL